ncbi:MAG TPA: hypothetical protein VF974_07615 [Patescibacteria group bacterium]
MANLPNLAASPGADFTSDTRMIGLAGNAGSSVAPGVTFKSSATEGVALSVQALTVGSPTVALLALGLGSTASAPAFQLLGQSFVSCTTILFTTGAVVGTGAIRVAYPDGVTLGWIPVLPSGSVTAAARG